MEAKEMNRAILEAMQKGHLSKDICLSILKELNGIRQQNDIAIIGMSCKYPKADNIADYWINLMNGINAIDTYSAENDLLNRLPPGSNIKMGYLSDIELFDAAFFNMTAQEAMSTNPNQRIFLEKAWEALEDAGYTKKRLKGSDTAVFVGVESKLQLKYDSLTEKGNEDEYVFGGISSMMASRLSYFLDLRGISIAIDSICSSGLIAVHLACKALRECDCALAVVGGVNLLDLSQKKLGAQQMDDGKICAFDNNAAGMVWSEGCGVVVLKGLRQSIKDGDNIYAIIKGGAVNNDGHTGGLTVAGSSAQADVMSKAWTNAGIDPADISYIESHGTGTLVGDCIEAKGISDALRRYTDKKQFCAISSAKPNIGHTVAASGIASLQKVVLSLCNEIIAPVLNFQEPNKLIDFIGSPIYVNDRKTKWPRSSKPRLAGVNSFAFNRTNCHLVVEEAPKRNETLPVESCYLFAMSARSQASLIGNAKKYIAFLNNDHNINLKNFCYTSTLCRDHYPYRKAFVLQNASELVLELQQFLHGLSESKREDAATSPTVDKQRIREATAKASDIAEALIAGAMLRSDALEQMGQLYELGADIAWEKQFAGEICQKLSIPSYSFNHKRYYIGLDTDRQTDKTEFVPPQTLLEEKICNAFSHVLERARTGTNDNFFEIGGNSLLAINLSAELERNGIIIDAEKIYTYSSPHDIANWLCDNGESEDEPKSVTPAKDIAIPDGTEDIITERLALMSQIEPFNTFYFKSCVYNAFFTAARHFGASIYGLISNYTQTFCFRDHLASSQSATPFPVPENGGHEAQIMKFRGQNSEDILLRGKKAGIEFIEHKSLEEASREQGLYLLRRADSDNIVDDVVAALQRSHLVIVCHDAFYTPIREDTYQKLHWVHYFLVYGFDLEKQTFSVVEHRHRDNLDYRQAEIPMQSLREAYDGGKQYFRDEKHRFWEIGSIDGMPHKDTPPEASALRDKLSDSAVLYREKIANGLSELKEFIKALRADLRQPQNLIDVIEGYVLAVNSVINAKDSLSHLILFANGEGSDEYQHHIVLSDTWKRIRMLLTKFMYTRNISVNGTHSLENELSVVLGLEEAVTGGLRNG